MASMGELLKMMQGGTDRTGFADMADQYAYTKPDRSAEERLALLKAAMEAGQGGEEGGEEEGGETGGFDFGGALDYIGEKGIDVKNFLEEKFGDYVPDSIANMSGEDIEKDEELTSLFGEMKIDGNRALKNVSTPKVASTGVPKTGTVAFEPKPFGANLLKYFKKSPLGIALMPTELGAADFGYELLDEGMADGGRVGMQQGGAPGGMPMPALLGVSSGSSGNLFSNYMPNPSAVPGPNYGTTAAPNYSTYQAPSLTSLFSPYSGNQFGNIGDSLGGPDPYAVGYNPYVDMGGSAYDQYGMGMTQEDIDKVFADTDKFSLAAQEAKRKAAEEAAKKKAVKERDGGQGGGGDRGHNNPDGGAPGPSGNTCFVKGTMLQMADGTTKEISTVELGDNTKGGIVLMTMQALPETIYNYKDVLVSGSHWVVENNQFVAVEDSKHGVLTNKVEPVYTLKTSDHRMWVNDIEFGDFETGSDEDWEPYVEAIRQKLNKQLDEKTH